MFTAVIFGSKKGKLFLSFGIGLFLALGMLRGPLGPPSQGAEAKDPPPADGSRQAVSLMTDRDNFYGVYAADKDHVWVVGYWGKILHTADGGKTWQIQKSPTTDPLFSVSFADTQRGVITGRDGALLFTEDGGKIWKFLQNPKKVHLISVSHSDPQNFWAVGDFGTIIHSYDGGRIWKDESLQEDTILNMVYFFDTQNGWIVGEFGKILHTADGGKTWTPQTNILGVYKDPELTQFGVYLYAVGFSDLMHGWAVGQTGTILYTEDGGKTWTNTPVENTHNTQTLFAIAQGKGKAFAVGSVGTVLASHASPSNSWKVKGDLTIYSWLRGIHFSDPDHGWMVGGRGTVFKTEDGGNRWQPIVSSKVRAR